MAANLPRTVCVKAGPIVIDGGNGTWCISITGDTGDLIPGGGGNGTIGPHNHTTSDIIGLDGKLSVLTQADLDINANLVAKANLTHKHPTSDITGLDGALANITAGKANITHNHTASDITGLDIYIPKPTGATANQVLTYNGTLWTAANARAALPAGTASGELLTFNGSVWVGTGATMSATDASTHYTNRSGQGYTSDDSGLRRVGLLDPARYVDATFLTLADCNARYLPTPTVPATANQVLTYDGANWVAADTVSAYVLPVANLTTLGGVKQGANVTIDPTGLLSVNLPAAANLTGYIPKPATATANQVLTYNGTVWNAANAPITGLTKTQADLLYQPIGGGMQVLTDAANIVWPLDPSKIAEVTLGGTRTLSNPTGKAAGGVYLIMIKQNATGGFALHFGTEYKFPSGIKPIIPVAANSVTILTFVSDGVNMYGLQQGDFK